MNLGENLRALRQSRGMTQQQAAERLNVTRQTVSGAEAVVRRRKTRHL